MAKLDRKYIIRRRVAWAFFATMGSYCIAYVSNNAYQIYEKNYIGIIMVVLIAALQYGCQKIATSSIKEYNKGRYEL